MRKDIEDLETPLNFGKYRSNTLREIADEDPHYLRWLIDEERIDPDLFTSDDQEQLEEWVRDLE